MLLIVFYILSIVKESYDRSLRELQLKDALEV